MQSAPQTDSPITLRTHGPGDIGHIISRHGAIYAEEYGWTDLRFEALIARTCADFIDSYDPSLERLWIAERDGGGFVGCIMLFRDNEGIEKSRKTAMLRLLLVEPSERGKGVGRRLVRQAVDFARQEAGYERIAVWMQSAVPAAKAIYNGEGFKQVRELEHEAFGVMLAVEYWELNFEE